MRKKEKNVGSDEAATEKLMCSEMKKIRERNKKERN